LLYSPLAGSCSFVDPPLLVLLLLLFSPLILLLVVLLLLLSSHVLCSYFYSSPLLSFSTITVFLDINLGDEMAELPLSDLPSNYAFDCGFQPTLGMAEHPYPSIVSNIF
jgi:hypothetical protein